jgi:hypothetical protein
MGQDISSTIATRALSPHPAQPQAITIAKDFFST